MSRTDLDAVTLANSLRAEAGDGSMEWVYQPIQASVLLDIADMLEENAKLRELCADMWRLIEDLDATPYVTERQGNNPAVTWLDEDLSVHESCKKRIRELGVEVDG